VRVWDVSPGYLSRQSLLGEHRELHGVYAILTQGKRGYAQHPETRRWAGALSGLIVRHAHLVAEMRLRGYADRTPLVPLAGVVWPATLVTPPHEQFAILRKKYAGAQVGRIPLPRRAQQIWAQHKYSVLARSPTLYREVGRALASARPRTSLPELAHALTLALRVTPDPGPLVNALEHMWGHIADHATSDERRAARTGVGELLRTIQSVATRVGEPYLMASTALGELGAYVDG
jgi:hypothetical protein